MKHLFFNFITIFSFLLYLAQFGCNMQSPSASPDLHSKSTTVILKATEPPKNNVTLNDVPVVGGTLNISQALIDVVKIKIEENQGFEGEQEGEHNDGDSENENEENKDQSEVTLSGPYTLDISNGEAYIDTVRVYPGTFTKVDLEFGVIDREPFNGSSILISGEYKPPQGEGIPFFLSSAFSEEVEATLADGGLSVPADTTISITIILDIFKWFANVNFNAAQVDSGKIMIDNQNNITLLRMFEKNLEENINVEREGEYEK